LPNSCARKRVDALKSWLSWAIGLMTKATMAKKRHRRFRWPMTVKRVWAKVAADRPVAGNPGR
jgi:hypothetical protein